MKIAIFRLIDYYDRTMSTAYVLSIGGGQVDRSCSGRAAETDSVVSVHECTMREDADDSIKRSVLKGKNRALAQNLGGGDSEFYEEVASSTSEEESYSCE